MSDEAEYSVEEEHGSDAEFVDEVVGGGSDHEVGHAFGDDDGGDVGDQFSGVDDAHWS